MGYNSEQYQKRKQKKAEAMVSDANNAKRLIDCLKRWEINGCEGTDFVDIAWDILPKDLQQWLWKKSQLSRQFKATRPADVMFNYNVAVGESVTILEAMNRLGLNVRGVAAVIKDMTDKGYKIAVSGASNADGTVATKYTITSVPKEDKNVQE